MRGLLALIAVEVGRLAARRARIRGEDVALEPAAATLAGLRALIEQHFRKERRLSFYAEKLGLSVDWLNAQARRAAGVTAGHLIRQRVLTEAKRELVFTGRPIHDIAADLAFSDPSHFARFFRKQTGAAPHEFRAARGG
jgi:AraC family transcriptional activator of pobA